MAEPYKPVACSFYDELEAFATLGTSCEIRVREGESLITLHGRIRDLYTREGVEYLRLDAAPAIRLDKIERVNGKETSYRC